MQVPSPDMTPLAVANPSSDAMYCFIGTVNLFELIQPSTPGTVIGRLHTPIGVTIPLTQTNPIPKGTKSLSAVNHHTATLCGNFVFRDGFLALDVGYAAPGNARGTPRVSSPALLALALLGLLPDPS